VDEQKILLAQAESRNLFIEPSKLTPVIGVGSFSLGIGNDPFEVEKAAKLVPSRLRLNGACSWE
jgi:hypothetical protein